MTEKSSFGPFLLLSEKDNVLVARANSADVLARGAALAGSSCWNNSPQARTAIHGAIAAAQEATRQPRSSGTQSLPNS